MTIQPELLVAMTAWEKTRRVRAVTRLPAQHKHQMMLLQALSPRDLEAVRCQITDIFCWHFIIYYRPYPFFFNSGCQSLVSSDTGYGSIRSSKKTKYWESKIACDWVIVGKPSSKLALSFRDNKVSLAV